METYSGTRENFENENFEMKNSIISTVRYNNGYNTPFSPLPGAGALGTDQTALWFL